MATASGAVFDNAVTAEEEAYRHLHSALRLGRYRAGDRLIPEDIAAEIGMGRMPVSRRSAGSWLMAWS